MAPFPALKIAPAERADGASATDIPEKQPWIDRFGWLALLPAVLAVYCVSLGNFFTFDDFIWLHRAVSFSNDWMQILRPDVCYFDPLVHLSFLLDFQIAGLNPRWYHCVDLTMHAVNAILVYRLARLLGPGSRGALYGAFIFAGSFAVADAVLWPSSRVDLLVTLCSLSCLIQFLHYLRSARKSKLLLSFLFLILALASKGTALVVPLILFWLMVQERKPLTHLRYLIPFLAPIPIYVVLLRLTMHQASLPLDRLHFNLHNLALSFSALYIPEALLDHFELVPAAMLLLIVVSLLVLAPLSPLATHRLRRTGYLIMLTALLPVLITTDFKLVTDHLQPYTLLVSPSHRIYMASVGLALLVGALIASLENLLLRSSARLAGAAVAIVLAGILTGDAYLVRQRNQLWAESGAKARAAIEGLLAYRSEIFEGAHMGLIGFPGSGGFQLPMIKTFLHMQDLHVARVVDLGVIDDWQALPDPDNSYLFVFGRDGHVYDKTQLYRRQLLLNRLALQSPDHPQYALACARVASRLYDDIERIR